MTLVRGNDDGVLCESLCRDQDVAIQRGSGGGYLAGTPHQRPEIGGRAPGSGRDRDIAKLARQLVEVREAALGADPQQLPTQLVVGDFGKQRLVLGRRPREPIAHLAILARVADPSNDDGIQDELHESEAASEPTCKGARSSTSQVGSSLTSSSRQRPIIAAMRRARSRATSSAADSVSCGNLLIEGHSSAIGFRAVAARTTRLDESQSFPTSFTDELTRQRQFAYDANSGLQSTTDLAGKAWQYTYAASKGSAIDYDVFDGTTALRHHRGGAQAYRYAAGPSTEYRDVDTLGTSHGDGSFAHHLDSVTSPLGQTTRFVRGRNGRIERVEYPDGGAKTIQYGPDGQPDTVVRPQGTALGFEWAVWRRRRGARRRARAGAHDEHDE